MYLFSIFVYFFYSIERTFLVFPSVVATLRDTVSELVKLARCTRCARVLDASYKETIHASNRI